MEMQLLLVSVNKLIKLPRSPPGPSYNAKNLSTNQEESGLGSKHFQVEKKLMLMVLQDENIEKQFEALDLLQLFTKPQKVQLSEEDLI